jgi:hypothetical protein
MKPKLALAFAALLILGSCKETIIENQIPKEFTNDLLHGDIIGKVAQINSGAVVTINQVTPIASAPISSVDGSFAFRDLRAGNYDVTIESSSFRIYQRSNVEVKGGGITYLGTIDLSSTPDLVDSFYPENMSEIVYDWRYGRITISILFTHPMDRTSVEQAFSTEPPSEGIFIWGNYTTAPLNNLWSTDVGGRFNPGATITTFSKITSLTYSMSKANSYVDSTYKVTLSTTAHDTSGNYLRFPLQFSFRTVQSYVSIYGIQTNPVHGDINVDPLSNSGIEVTFPRRMNHESTESATSVSPPMTTIFLWPSDNVFRIYTGGPFLADTTIAVNIRGSAQDLDGVPMGEDFSFWFRTAPFAVTSTYPANGQLFVPVSQGVTMTFNSYVTLSSVAPSFTITPNVIGSFAYTGTAPYDNPNQVVFTPGSGFLANTKYTVTLSTGVTDLYGVRMKSGYTFSFVTRRN